MGNAGGRAVCSFLQWDMVYHIFTGTVRETPDAQTHERKNKNDRKQHNGFAGSGTSCRKGGVSVEKRFFWLKLRESFFNDTYIKAMRTLPHGDNLVVTYLEMALYSLKTNGVIEYGELMPSLNEEIAIAINEPVSRVKKTIDLLIKSRAAEFDGNNLCLTEMMKLMGSESTSAERMRKLRSKKSDEPAVTSASQSDNAVTSQVTKSVTTEIEKEKEIESEQEQDTPLPPSGETRDYPAIVEQFNSVCEALPKVRDITEPRKKAISSALKRLGDEGLTELFRKTAASDFLSGRKGEWKATFDWILKPANLTKIIEGNYDNADSAAQQIPEKTDYTCGGKYVNMLEQTGELDEYPF